MIAVLEAREPSARYLEAVQPSLVRQFKLVATAPEGMVRLRELVLTLAVRGRLVAQDPADEPASAILDQVGLVQSAQKPRGRRQEGANHAFRSAGWDRDVPKGWTAVRNSDLFSLRKGRVPSGLSDAPSGIPYLDIDALDRGLIKRYTNDQNCPTCTVDDILVVCDGSRSGLVLQGKNGAVGSTLAVIETPRPLQSYVKLIFREGFRRFNSGMKGAAIPHLDTKSIFAEVVGLPPLREQARIVARVDELMQLCDALEAKGRLEAEQRARLLGTLLGTLTDSTTPEELATNWQRVAEHFDLLLDQPEAVDVLEQTVLQLAVRGLLVPQDEDGEPTRVVLERINLQRRLDQKHSRTAVSESDPLDPPYTLPREWEWARLGDLVENMGSGWSPACEDGERTDSARWAVLRTTAVQVMEYRANEHKAIPLKLAPRPEIEVKPGDILVTRAGPMNRVGISCWVDQTPQRLMLSDKIVRFNPVSDELLPAYVVLALNAGWTRQLLEAAKTGMAASQVNVSQADLKSLWIPICSRREQSCILARVTELRRLCADLRQRLAASQATQSRLAEALVEAATT